MECIIPGTNIRVLSRSIQALAKLSDEIYIVVEENALSLISTNTSKTAFAKHTFHYAFFTSFNVQTSNDDSQDIITCRVTTKSLYKIFKLKPNKEKKLELCKIELEHDASSIMVKLRYKHEINAVHQVSLIDYQTISISYDDDSMKSKIMGPGHLFMKILSDLQPNDSEINVNFCQDNAVIRNYDTSSKTVQKGVRLQMTLAAKEFVVYNIEEETSLTFSLKPFRSAINFANNFNMNVTWHIESAGRPTVLSMKSTTFTIIYVISTANTDDSQTQLTTSSMRSKVSNDKSLPVQEPNNVTNIERPRASFNEILNNLLQDNRQEDEEGLNSVRISLDEPETSSYVSSQSKRIRMIFSKLSDGKLSETILFKNAIVLAPNSDSETE